MADITVINRQEISTGATPESTATQPLPVEPVTLVPPYVEDLTEGEAEQEAVATEEPKFLSLEEILGMDIADLTAEKQGFFHSEKLGNIPYTAISYDDYKQAKKDCVTYDQDENGVIQTKVDDDKLMTKIVILAVDKDHRSNFTFANGALLKKLGVHTAEGALSTLLPPGEIVNFAVAVQNASGFGNKAKKKVKDSVKKLLKSDREAKLLAYIWNTQGITPGQIYNLPYSEKEFIYQATLLKIKEEQRAVKARQKKR